MNLDSMNTKQLRAFKDKIDAMIAAKQAKAKEDLRLKFQAMASEAGIRLSDLVGGTAGKKSAKVMKWRDKSTGIEWSGHGRRPLRFNMNSAVRIG
jgi:DNA-binding protein H-NS